MTTSNSNSVEQEENAKQYMANFQNQKDLKLALYTPKALYKRPLPVVIGLGVLGLIGYILFNPF